MIVGLGIDLVAIPRSAASLARVGQRFECMLFTDDERAYCRARATPAQHFAARFAAKEAALKAMGVPSGLAWHELEVQQAATGVPRLLLSGAALRHVGRARCHLSLTHDGDMAAAVVVLEA